MAQYAEAESKGDVAKMIALQGAIKFNGGGAPVGSTVRCCVTARGTNAAGGGPTRGAGHVNHSLFWKNLCPPKVRCRPCAARTPTARPNW